MKIVKTKNKSGTNFYGLISTPETSTNKIIIHIHGMSGSITINGFYPLMHEEYTKAGFAFLVGEHSGTGSVTEFGNESEAVGTKIIGNAFEKFEDSVDDIDAWVNFAKDLGYTEIWLQSHSLGCSKTSYYVAIKKPESVRGLLLISPADMVGLVHYPEGQKEHDVLFPEATKLVSEGKGKQLLSNLLWGENYLSADTYLNFFGEGSNLAVFNFNDDNLGWDTVNAINVPVLAFTGTKDDAIVPIMDPKLAMEKLEKELKNSPKIVTKVYENCTHSFDGFEKEVVKDVLEFVKK